MKEDCFANKGGKCNALELAHCDGCKFYKTLQQEREELINSKRRLQRISLWEHYQYTYKLGEIMTNLLYDKFN